MAKKMPKGREVRKAKRLARAGRGTGSHFDDVVLGFLGPAWDEGLQRPVVLLCGERCAAGREVFLEASGGKDTLIKHSGAGTFDVAGPVGVAEACRLLRRHAGPGGAAAANLLGTPPRPADGWALAFEEDVLSAVAYDGGTFAYSSGVYYRGEEFLESMGVARDIKGQERDHHLAVALQYLAEHRRLPCHETEVAAAMPVDERLMSRILRQYYAGKAYIVEVLLEYLREVSPEARRWLRGLLRRRPELAALAAEVLGRHAGGDGHQVGDA